MDNEKLYGSSILSVDERLNKEDGDKIFEDIRNSYTDKDISDMRNELKNNGDKGSLDRVYTDAISGIKSSEKIATKKSSGYDYKEERKKRISENFKKVALAGSQLIKSVTGKDTTDEMMDQINGYFEKMSGEINKNNSLEYFSNMTIDELTQIVGFEVSDPVMKLAMENKVDVNVALAKFVNQLYSSYVKLNQYNDDVNDVYDITMKALGNLNMDSNNADLKDQYNNMNKVLAKLKNLDERNERLKPEYSIDDYDITTMENLSNDLESALEFRKLYKKVNKNEKQLIKESRSVKDMKSKIKNWISDLKSDKDTLYVFPINDYLNANESLDALINYIKSFILLQDKHDEYDKILSLGTEDMKDMESIDNIEEYMLAKKYVTRAELNNYEKSAILFLYIMSRVFRIKKIKTDDDRRILSYTLDIICKIDNVEYSEILMKFINVINTVILGIDSYNFIIANNTSTNI